MKSWVTTVRCTGFSDGVEKVSTPIRRMEAQGASGLAYVVIDAQPDNKKARQTIPARPVNFFILG